jgi:tetratricopeptide (TPR) repeat protein
MGRCQLLSWKSHKLVCISPSNRLIRVGKMLYEDMEEAEARWDSAEVVEQGLRCVADLQLVRHKTEKVQWGVEMDLFDKLARAYSRQGNTQSALEYYVMAAKVCEKTGETTRHGVFLSNCGDKHTILSEYEEASKCYKEVGRLGEGEGSFEMYAMSQLGLSGVARKTNRKSHALELAR